MSTNHTPNYQLNQWVRSDKVLMEDFNADNAKIDAALAGKADKATVETLAGETAALAGKLGNCKAVLHTYVGDGTYGGDHPTSFSFDGEPPTLMFLTSRDTRSLILHKNILSAMGYDGAFYINWTDEGVSWYSVKGAEQQFNLNGVAYNVLLFYLTE